jgi:hypothetical protein
VSAIVERHDGRVSVEGSTFTVELPATDQIRAGGPGSLGGPSKSPPN